MDVHLRSTTVCALDAETGEAVTRRFRGNPWGEVAEWMSGFPGPSLAAYESGYLGFAPQRELSGLGVDCVVAAVSRVPRSAADLSSKNDRNDAARMAKAILSHDVTPVWVPSPEIEGLRDLAAAHDAATARLAAAKQRLLAFLARRGYAYGGTTPAGNPRRYWTYDFLRWLDKVRPADDGGIRALAALRSEVEAASETRDDLLAEYRAAVAAGPPPAVKTLVIGQGKAQDAVAAHIAHFGLLLLSPAFGRIADNRLVAARLLELLVERLPERRDERSARGEVRGLAQDGVSLQVGHADAPVLPIDAYAAGRSTEHHDTALIALGHLHRLPVGFQQSVTLQQRLGKGVGRRHANPENPVAAHVDTHLLSAAELQLIPRGCGRPRSLHRQQCGNHIQKKSFHIRLGDLFNLGFAPVHCDPLPATPPPGL